MLALTLAIAISPSTGSWQDPQQLDLADDSHRQTVVDRETGQYLGHVSTVLLEDGKTILAVYPKGHGKGPIVYKRSTDGGLTWSERLPVPANWSTSLEVPTIHRTVDAEGNKRLILWSGLHPARLAQSQDDGQTWSPLEPAGEWGGIVVMGDVAATKTPGRYLAWFHDDGRFLDKRGQRSQTFQLLQVESTDGGVSWSTPRVIWAGSDVNHCEPGFIRSPDGSEIALLLRENRRKLPSHFMISRDEGATWSDPEPMHPALTGDRHTLRYTKDGRVVAVFRDTQLGDNPTKGDFVAWVGTYQDIVNGRGGQYRVRLLDNYNAWDCGYPGLEVLPDDTLVATTYGHWEDGLTPFIKSVRFTVNELDRIATAPDKPPATQPGLVSALQTLENYQPGEEPPVDPKVVNARRRLWRAIPELVEQGGPVADQLADLLTERQKQLIPSPENPIRTNDPLARVLVRFDDERTQRLPMERMMPHRAAATFPGAVPLDALPEVRQTSADLKKRGRHSLGAYAAPGQPVYVQFNNGGTAPPKGTRLRIGAHSDDIGPRKSWTRMPRVSRTFEITRNTMVVANAYGGVLYLESDRSIPVNVRIQLANVYLTPYFQMATMSDEAWREEARGAPAPWAELASNKVVLTVPSASIRNLDSPSLLLKFYDGMLDTCASLATRPIERERLTRIVTDIEIRTGKMHAGYPIMAQLDTLDDLISVNQLRQGQWRLFREVGANHVNEAWTFEGSERVMANMFALCLSEKICAIPWDQAWDGRLARAQQRLFELVQAGKKPWDAMRGKNNNQIDVPLRLLLYMQIQRKFGWEGLGHTFVEYRDEPKEKQPQTEQGKRDLFMVRLSKAIDRDLGPYFDGWGITTSPEARAEVADLLDWWPGDWQFQRR